MFNIFFFFFYLGLTVVFYCRPKHLKIIVYLDEGIRSFSSLVRRTAHTLQKLKKKKETPTTVAVTTRRSSRRARECRTAPYRHSRFGCRVTSTFRPPPSADVVAHNCQRRNIIISIFFLFPRSSVSFLFVVRSYNIIIRVTLLYLGTRFKFLFYSKV